MKSTIIILLSLVVGSLGNSPQLPQCVYFENEGEIRQLDGSMNGYVVIEGRDTLDSCFSYCCSEDWCHYISFYEETNRCIAYVFDDDLDRDDVVCEASNIVGTRCQDTHWTDPGYLIKKDGVITRQKYFDDEVFVFNHIITNTMQNSLFVGNGACNHNLWPQDQLGMHYDIQLFDLKHARANCLEYIIQSPYRQYIIEWANYKEFENYALCRIFYSESSLRFYEIEPVQGDNYKFTQNNRTIPLVCTLDDCSEEHYLDLTWIDENTGAEYTQGLDFVASQNKDDFCFSFKTEKVDCGDQSNLIVGNNFCINMDVGCISDDDTHVLSISFNGDSNSFPAFKEFCMYKCFENPEWCSGYSVYSSHCELLTHDKIYKNEIGIPLYSLGLTNETVGDFLRNSFYCVSEPEKTCQKSILPFYFTYSLDAECGILQSNCSYLNYEDPTQGKCDTHMYSHDYALNHFMADEHKQKLENFCRVRCCSFDWCNAFEYDDDKCYFMGNEMPDIDTVSSDNFVFFKNERVIGSLDDKRTCLKSKSFTDEICPSDVTTLVGHYPFDYSSVTYTFNTTGTKEECRDFCCKHSFWCDYASYYLVDGVRQCKLSSKMSTMNRYYNVGELWDNVTSFNQTFLGEELHFDCEISCKTVLRTSYQRYGVIPFDISSVDGDVGIDWEDSTLYIMGNTDVFDVNKWFVTIDNEFYFDELHDSESGFYVSLASTRDLCFQIAPWTINLLFYAFDVDLINFEEMDLVVVFKEDEPDPEKRCTYARLSSFDGDIATVSGNHPGAIMATRPFIKNITIECPSVSDQKYCLDENTECGSFFGNSHFVTLERLEGQDSEYAKTLCFDACKNNSRWCQGVDFDYNNNNCKLFTFESIFFEPGTEEVPIFEVFPEYDLSEAPLCEYRKVYPSCKESDIFPIEVVDNNDNVCAITIGGECDSTMRRHYQGHCFGDGFKDYVYVLDTSTNDNDVITKCKQICCDANWCSAMEVMFEDDIGHKCIFMVDKQRGPIGDTFTTDGIVLYKETRKVNQNVEFGRICYATEGSIDTAFHPSIPMRVLGTACGRSDLTRPMTFSIENVGTGNLDDPRDSLEWCYNKCFEWHKACQGLEYALFNDDTFSCHLFTDMGALSENQNTLFTSIRDAVIAEQEVIAHQIDGEIFTTRINDYTVLMDSTEIVAWPESRIDEHHFFADQNKSIVHSMCMVERISEDEGFLSNVEDSEVENAQTTECPSSEYYLQHVYGSKDFFYCAKLCHSLQFCKGYHQSVASSEDMSIICDLFVDWTHESVSEFEWEGLNNYVHIHHDTFFKKCDVEECTYGDNKAMPVIETENAFLTRFPTIAPTQNPTTSPTTGAPSSAPTISPTSAPTLPVEISCGVKLDEEYTDGVSVLNPYYQQGTNDYKFSFFTDGVERRTKYPLSCNMKPSDVRISCTTGKIELTCDGVIKRSYFYEMVQGSNYQLKIGDGKLQTINSIGEVVYEHFGVRNEGKYECGKVVPGALYESIDQSNYLFYPSGVFSDDDIPHPGDFYFISINGQVYAGTTCSNFPTLELDCDTGSMRFICPGGTDLVTPTDLGSGTGYTWELTSTAWHIKDSTGTVVHVIEDLSSRRRVLQSDRGACKVNSNFVTYKPPSVNEPLELNVAVVVVASFLVIAMVYGYFKTKAPLNKYLGWGAFATVCSMTIYITFILNQSSDEASQVVNYFILAVSGMVYVSLIGYVINFKPTANVLKVIVTGATGLAMFDLWIALQEFASFTGTQALLSTLTASSIAAIVLVVVFGYATRPIMVMLGGVLMGILTADLIYVLDEFVGINLLQAAIFGGTGGFALFALLFLLSGLGDQNIFYIMVIVFISLVIGDVTYGLYEFTDLGLQTSLIIGGSTLATFFCCGCACLTSIADD